jgi:PAS domain-containing protein
VFGKDRDLRYVWIGSSSFGRTPDAVIGKTDADLFDAEGARQLGEIKRRVMIGAHMGSRHTATLMMDDKPRIYDLYLEPLIGESGKVVGVTGVHTDITRVVPKVS